MDNLIILIEKCKVMYYNLAMNTKRKKDGFKNQKLFVIPEDITKEVSRHPLGEDLLITDIGYFPDAQYHYRERKEGSQQHILIYCLSGSGFVRINNKEEKIKENSLIFLPANMPHAYGADKDKPWDIYWAHFAGKKSNYYYWQKEGEIAQLSIDKIPTITQLFDSIFENLKKGYTLKNIIHSSHIFTHILSVFFCFNNRDNTEDKQARLINEIIKYMQKNLNRNLSLQELAELSKLSISHLSMVFQQKTGKSPMDYFTGLKIQQACRYLDLTDKKIKEISILIGYSDPYYFSRVFKKVMGISPSKYRRIKKG
ncbi:AraC family transcriptional regulator [Natronospora cellulosivora (SeqCode)]